MTNFNLSRKVLKKNTIEILFGNFQLSFFCEFASSLIVHYDTSAMKCFLTSVSLQHEPKASDLITLVKKTFFARVSYEILYHEV